MFKSYTANQNRGEPMVLYTNGKALIDTIDVLLEYAGYVPVPAEEVEKILVAKSRPRKQGPLTITHKDIYVTNPDHVVSRIDIYYPNSGPFTSEDIISEVEIVDYEHHPDEEKGPFLDSNDLGRMHHALECLVQNIIEVAQTHESIAA